jgi:hypothetical protein
MGKRNIRIKAQPRKQPDYRKLSRALLELAAAQAEADAQGMGNITPGMDNVIPGMDNVIPGINSTASDKKTDIVNKKKSKRQPRDD